MRIKRFILIAHRLSFLSIFNLDTSEIFWKKICLLVQPPRMEIQAPPLLLVVAFRKEFIQSALGYFDN